MWLFSKNKQNDREIDALYTAILTQARQPGFYQKYAVKDNEDGRFDLLVLHLSLIFMIFKKSKDKEAPRYFRQLSEKFVADMDASLRELGAGDLGVARRVKFMAGALNGRLLAYETALNNDDREALKNALVKNLYRGGPVLSPQMEAMIQYVEEAYERLKSMSLIRIIEGKANFPDIPQA